MTSRTERKAAKSLLRVRGLYVWGSSDFPLLGSSFCLSSLSAFSPFHDSLIQILYAVTGSVPEAKEKNQATMILGFENTQQIAASGTYSMVIKRTLIGLMQ